ncbi:hypothetical protein Entas_4590 (plasmid) [Enterobacter soli]|uniref:hypothetical protein n=1 Tax=Enterobacter soli TaxID=885040 RepID=UPI000223CF78|nr:hypothetical protein [Enterobacter soli]AEN67271.1 hypothetical protein Entas_4590 [Enterobacter soli]OAT34948.1 hypothetical protein M987_04630 [Enterobacter soli ATCC BAA-2102]
MKKPIVRNFHNGDLMYGLSGPREIYLKEVEEYHKKNPSEANSWARRPVGRASMSMIINSYSDPVRSVLSLNNIRFSSLNDITKSRTKKIKDAIKMASVGKTSKYGFDFPAYQEIAINHPKLRIAAKHNDEYQWWKRGSKSGIEIIAQQPSQSHRKIHFILDGLDVAGVVNKKIESITSSELRYIYRRWDRLNGRIIFYFGGNVCPPPWTSPRERDIWSGYTPKSTIPVDDTVA